MSDAVGSRHRRALGAGALATLVVAAACGGGTTSTERGLPRAVATISILADFVEAVGGAHLDTTTIVHVGGDPHTYEPTPSDARRIAEADIVFRNGLGLERWLDRLVASADAPVVTLTDGLQPLVQDEGEYRGDPDPHLWMDPRLAADYVSSAREALTELLPEHADELEANANAYLAELEELERWIEERFEQIPEASRKLVTTHDAFRYFGERFGFRIVGTIWSISTEREPSAEEIARLVDAVRSEGVPAVFIETTINPAIMTRVARDAGVRIGEPLYGDSVGEPGSGADTYIGMMRANTLAVLEGLAPAAP